MRCRYRPPDVRRVLLLAVAAVVLAGAGDATAAPLIPRELSSLALGRRTRSSGSTTAAARTRSARRAALVSRRLGIWRLPSRTAQRLVPGLAVAGSIVDFEAEQPRWRSDHRNAGDPLLPEQWWLGMIGADHVEPPGPGRPLTVVDSGVDLTHPEFASRPDTRVLGDQRLIGNTEFHGDRRHLRRGGAGERRRARRRLPARAPRDLGRQPPGLLSSSAVIQGIEAALSLGPGVINLSIGGTTRSGFEELAIYDAVARGSVVVAASGNEREEGDPPNYPASLPHVLTVGAVGGNGPVTTFSSTSEGMDVVAPGESVLHGRACVAEPGPVRARRRDELRLADGRCRGRVGLDGAARARRESSLRGGAAQRLATWSSRGGTSRAASASSTSRARSAPAPVRDPRSRTTASTTSLRTGSSTAPRRR